MRKKNKICMKISLVCLCFVMTLTGCSFGNAGTDLGVVGLSYYDEMGEEGYNTDLFYVNDLSTRGADPGVLYISEGEYPGAGKGTFLSFPVADENFCDWSEADVSIDAWDIQY